MSQTEYTIEELLANYMGRPEYVRGPEGDIAFRKSLKTDALQLTDESMKSDTLTPEEADDVLSYFGWNIWDVLGTRATEGENGLIPRQEYEALSTVEFMQKFPELWDLVTEEVGGDGVIDIGATARREIGTKVNALHVWCAGASFVTGRGITMGLGHYDKTGRAESIARALQFNRRLARGMWGDEGGMFASQRNYRVPLLEGTDWLERFRDEAVFFEDPAQHAMYTKFNATAQLLVFLLHFDNRLGLGDSGPYPTENGGFLIVRDHFLNDPAYHWFDVADELPHCITQAMYFKPPPEMKVIVNDLSTTFTQPASYIPYMTGMAVYARDKWDTPASDVRLVSEDDIKRYTGIAQKAMMRLYKRISGMSRRDRITCGVTNYVVDWALPFLRLSGTYDKAIAQGWLEWDEMTSQSYYPLVRDGQAGPLLPEAIIAGKGAQSMQAG
ncbi:MAG: hypothetical protein QOE28_1986 [Solirubrobacteraceae bacterium]|nr:hypothetical protein [Solirubrobacteraceae bacterium]